MQTNIQLCTIQQLESLELPPITVETSKLLNGCAIFKLHCFSDKSHGMLVPVAKKK